MHDITKRRSYAVAGETGGGKSTLALHYLPRLLGTDTVISHSLTTDDVDKLRSAWVPATDTPTMSASCRRSETWSSSRSGFVESVVADVVRLWETACRNSAVNEAEMTAWLRDKHRAKLGRTTFVIDEIGRSLDFGGAIVTSDNHEWLGHVLAEIGTSERCKNI